MSRTSRSSSSVSTVTTSTIPSSSSFVLPASASATPVCRPPSSTLPAAQQPARLVIRIDDEWYDITAFSQTHPGGAEILVHLNGKDATDAFYSLHSKSAIQRLKRMKGKPCTEAEKKQTPQLLKSFRQFREELVQKGFWQRSAFWELFYAISIYGMASLGTYLTLTGAPLLGVLFIGLAMEQAGWVGHDYVHGRGDYCSIAGQIMAGFINGFSPSWWSNKHNTHHVYTNYIGIDTDIQNDPVFHLFFPTNSSDVFFRKYQHLYFFPVASFIYISWRIQSVLHAWNTRNYKELALLSVSYCWLAVLPAWVSIGAILFGGLLVAVVVTTSHQSEEMLESEQLKQGEYNYVKCQFDTTRDSYTADNIVLEWLFGGMQYQLEHHLFPTMPKYYYHRVSPLVQKWAKENGVEYKVDSPWQIICRNLQTLKYYSLAIEEAAKQVAK